VSYTTISQGTCPDFRWLSSNISVLNRKIFKKEENYEGFEVIVAVTMKNVIMWDVAQCGSCYNR
jgi:hypothetical protein